MNITAVVPDIIAWLKETPGYQTSETYKTIRQHYSETDGESMAMRLLIHYAGDFHQPLHTMEVLDKEFPAGDRGGNYFHL